MYWILALSVVVGHASALRWQSVSYNSQLPLGAVIGAEEAEGLPVYIARVQSDGNSFAAKSLFNRQFATYFCDNDNRPRISRSGANFDILVSDKADPITWLAYDGSIPQNAITAGEVNGNAQYVIRSAVFRDSNAGRQTIGRLDQARRQISFEYFGCDDSRTQSQRQFAENHFPLIEIAVENVAERQISATSLRFVPASRSFNDVIVGGFETASLPLYMGQIQRGSGTQIPAKVLQQFHRAYGCDGNEALEVGLDNVFFLVSEIDNAVSWRSFDGRTIPSDAILAGTVNGQSQFFIRGAVRGDDTDPSRVQQLLGRIDGVTLQTFFEFFGDCVSAETFPLQIAVERNEARRRFLNQIAMEEYEDVFNDFDLDKEIGMKPGCENFLRADTMGRFHAQTAACSKTEVRINGIADASERAIRKMRDRIGDTFDTRDLEVIDAQNLRIAAECPNALNFQDNDIRCDQHRTIRTITGVCNNLRSPLVGATDTAFDRLLATVYDDGISSPRTRGPSGRVFPSARAVSNAISPEIRINDTRLNINAVYWGQFIDHDITLSPMARVPGTSGHDVPPQCCNVPDKCLHPECFPIQIPRDDPFYSQFGQTCMELARTVPALNGPGCRPGVREQLNAVTSFLDASAVYGSTEQRAADLRLFRDGRLKFNQQFLDSGIPLMPEEEDGEECAAIDGERKCFAGGDLRANENYQLTAFHSVFVREHNRIVNVLLRLGRQAGIPVTDEKLYQAGRKIVSAMLQKITYDDWLPLILGPRFTNDFRNELSSCAGDSRAPYCRDGFYTGYDQLVTASASNEFATAAFRFGHTLLADRQMRVNQRTDSLDELQLKDIFFFPFSFYEAGAIEEFLQGGSFVSAERYDSTLVDSVRNFLYRVPPTPFGMDLMALNIQRAREHGMQQYNDYRRFCGMPRARDFADLRDVMSVGAINRLRSVYASVDDIDLWAGGISERQVNDGDGTVGPTFACIIGREFRNLRKGDRFWFERSQEFTESQLEQIRRVTINNVVCETSLVKDVSAQSPERYFEQFSPNNRPAPCQSALNLREFVDLLR